MRYCESLPSSFLITICPPTYGRIQPNFLKYVFVKLINTNWSREPLLIIFTNFMSRSSVISLLLEQLRAISIRWAFSFQNIEQILALSMCFLPNFTSSLPLILSFYRARFQVKYSGAVKGIHPLAPLKFPQFI